MDRLATQCMVDHLPILFQVKTSFMFIVINNQPILTNKTRFDLVHAIVRTFPAGT